MITLLCLGNRQIDRQWFHATSRVDLLTQVEAWVTAHDTPQARADGLVEGYRAVLSALLAWTHWLPSRDPYEVYEDVGSCWVLLISRAYLSDIQL